MAKIDQIKAAIGAQQDQELEDAKRWCAGPKPGEFNAQVVALWEFCCADHPEEIVDMMSRFALIGLRYTLQQMDVTAPSR